MGCGQSNDQENSQEKYRSHRRRMKRVQQDGVTSAEETGSMVAEVTSQASHIPDDDDDWISLMGSEYEADRLIEQCRERKRRNKQRGAAGAEGKDENSDDEAAKAAENAQLDEERQNLSIIRWVDVVLASAFASYLLDEHSRKQSLRKPWTSAATGKEEGKSTTSFLDTQRELDSQCIEDTPDTPREETAAPTDENLESNLLSPPKPLSRNLSAKSLTSRDYERASVQAQNSDPMLKSPEDSIAASTPASPSHHSKCDGASSQLMSQSLLANSTVMDREPALESIPRDQHLMVLGACKAVAVSKLGMLAQPRKKQQAGNLSVASPREANTGTPTPNGLFSPFYDSIIEKLPPTVQSTRDPFEMIAGSDLQLISPNSQAPILRRLSESKNVDASSSPGEGSEYLATTNAEETSDSASWTEGKNDDVLLAAIGNATAIRNSIPDADSKRRSILDDDGEHLLTTEGLVRWEQEVDRAIVRCIVEKKGLPTASVDASELEDAGVEDYQIFRSIYTLHNPALLKSPCCQCPHPLGTPDAVTQWLHLILYSVALASPEPGAVQQYPLDVSSNTHSRISLASHASQTSSVHKHGRTGKFLIKNPTSVPELQSYLLRLPPLEKASFFAKATQIVK